MTNKSSASIRVVSTGIVYRNPKPYLRAVHTWHPTVALLKNGELLAAFDCGQGAESLDYRSYLSRSTDGGKTWSEPQRFYGEHPTPTSSIARINVTRDGTVVALGAYIFRNDTEQGLLNHQTFGYAPMQMFVMRSADGGRTWDAPSFIEPPLVGPSFELCHPILELADGRWLAPMSTWKGWNGEAPNGMKAIALVSTDRGRSWPTYLDVMDDYANGVIHFEQSMVELPDHRLLAVAWAYNEKTGRSQPTPYAISNDGRKFSPRRLTGLHGQTAKMVCLPDGRILCLYRRDDKPGLWANLSCIEGDDWVNLAEASVWQGAASGMQGEAAAGDELSNLKFGFPRLIVLPDGDVFAAFWCCEDCVNNIRWMRLQV